MDDENKKNWKDPKTHCRMFPVPTLIAVPVMPVPVVVIGGAPDGGNTQQQDRGTLRR